MARIQLSTYEILTVKGMTVGEVIDKLKGATVSGTLAEIKTNGGQGFINPAHVVRVFD